MRILGVLLSLMFASLTSAAVAQQYRYDIVWSGPNSTTATGFVVFNSLSPSCGFIQAASLCNIDTFSLTVGGATYTESDFTFIVDFSAALDPTSSSNLVSNGLIDFNIFSSTGPNGQSPNIFSLQNDQYVMTSFSSSSGNNSSSSGGDEVAVSTRSAITADVIARTTSTVLANNSMMDRLVSLMQQRRNLSTVDVESFVMRNANGPTGLRVTGFNANANDDGGFLFSSVSYSDVANGWQRIGFADLSFRDTQDVGSMLSLNGRMSWSRDLDASTLYGYFLGADINRSDIKGGFGGDQNSFGVVAGAFTVARAENGLIGSAYGAVGFNRSNLKIGDSTTSVTDTYDTRSVMLGAKLSGNQDYTTYRLRPSLAANYSQTHVGTLSVTETVSGTASDLSVAVGTVRLMDIVATPEFVFTGNALMEGHLAAEFTVAPRLTCERRDAATNTRNCGSGLALGLSSMSSDGMTTINGGVSFDRIGNENRRSIRLQAEMRF